MKKLIMALFLFIATMSLQAQEIRWLALDEALAKQKKNAKPIFMDVYTDWCGPCKYLDATTFHDAAIVEFVNNNYYAVKFNAEGNSTITYKGVKYANPSFDPNRKGRNSAHDFTKFLKVTGYPSRYIFDKKGEIKEPIVGYLSPEQLLILIK